MEGEGRGAEGGRQCFEDLQGLGAGKEGPASTSHCNLGQPQGLS